MAERGATERVAALEAAHREALEGARVAADKVGAGGCEAAGTLFPGLCCCV